MNIKVLTLSTHPRKTTDYWQCVFIPTVSAYFSSYDGESKHVAINFEWLFWSATILIYTDDNKGTVYQP
jgi:hypothetical protein